MKKGCIKTLATSPGGTRLLINRLRSHKNRADVRRPAGDKCVHRGLARERSVSGGEVSWIREGGVGVTQGIDCRMIADPLRFEGSELMGSALLEMYSACRARGLFSHRDREKLSPESTVSTDGEKDFNVVGWFTHERDTAGRIDAHSFADEIYVYRAVVWENAYHGRRAT